MIQHTFYCGDKLSHFRIEEDGRIRLILMPEDKAILAGHWTAHAGVLLLAKGKSNFQKRSYSLAVPKELWNGLEKQIKVISVHTFDTKRYYAVTRGRAAVYGYGESRISDAHGQDYLFIDREHWTEVDGVEGILGFINDEHARGIANRAQN